MRYFGGPLQSVTWLSEEIRQMFLIEINEIVFSKTRELCPDNNIVKHIREFNETSHKL